MPIQTYEVIIEEIHTYVITVPANNRGMAKIRAKLAIKQGHTGVIAGSTVVHVASCEVVLPEGEANAVS